MQASVVDLRYKTNAVFAALEHGEQVTLLYHGKPKGVIMPLTLKPAGSVTDHPFFGMYQHPEDSVEEVMDQLRGGRYAL
jgi:antitoxin (DNA-binding transcriptional repressor) of toxin-antitoxin stability system